jgi:hypothetical protein
MGKPSLETSLLNRLKKIRSIKREWADLLDDTLYVYKTTKKSLIGKSLFLLTYGIKAMIVSQPINNN